jgi:hypothetical protein
MKNEQVEFSINDLYAEWGKLRERITALEEEVASLRIKQQLKVAMPLIQDAENGAPSTLNQSHASCGRDNWPAAQATI